MDDIKLTQEQEEHVHKMAALLAEAVLGETIKLLNAASANTKRLALLNESFVAEILHKTTHQFEKMVKDHENDTTSKEDP